MGRFEESGEFRGGEGGDVAGSFAADDDGFLLIYDAVEDTRQVLAEAGVGGFGGHWRAVRMVQDSCTVHDRNAQWSDRLRSKAPIVGPCQPNLDERLARSTSDCGRLSAPASRESVDRNRPSERSAEHLSFGRPLVLRYWVWGRPPKSCSNASREVYAA